jgi:hypothetical protein
MDMQSAIGRAASRDRPAITAQERDRIVEMLRTLPIAEVKAKSRRSYLTLARMAEACL